MKSNNKNIFNRLRKELSASNVNTDEMQNFLRKLTIFEREEISIITGSLLQYYGKEVEDVQNAEKVAALRAMPPGYDMKNLNGIDIGSGNRISDPLLISTDAHRGNWEMGEGSDQIYHSQASILAWANDLPFKSNSIDFVTALHILEHEPDPIETVLHWLDIIKPGGGVGIILPDWRYTWDARNDNHPWGHRWNPTPQLLVKLFKEYWAKYCNLEHIDSYPFKLSFDIVLRKHGEFHPFDLNEISNAPTGHQLLNNGAFLHSDQ